MEGSDQLHAPAILPRKIIPGSHCLGGWVGPRAGLDVMEKKNKLLPSKWSMGKWGLKIDFRVWTGLIWLRIGNSCGLL
jgi:hypothetical protein